MQKGFWKRLSCEDKFDREFACWAANHKGWRKYKRGNRRAARRKLKKAVEKSLIGLMVCVTERL